MENPKERTFVPQPGIAAHDGDWTPSMGAEVGKMAAGKLSHLSLTL